MAASMMPCRRLRAHELGLAAFIALACSLPGALAAGELKNTWTGMSQSCKDDYYTLVSSYYYRNTECKELLFSAFNTTYPKLCPPTQPGSAVWNCLTRGTATPSADQNTNTYGNLWWDWIGKCDILWVAFRKALTEGEATTPESSLTSEELAAQSHFDYENDVPPQNRSVIPSFGIGEGERTTDRRLQSRSLKATVSNDEGEAAEYDGLHSYDNSCFMRFDSMEQLGTYFSTDPLTWNGASSRATAVRALAWTLAGIAVLIAALML